VAFLVGYTVLLRQLGTGPMVAFAGAVILCFSHLVQVWWTSNAPTFAFAVLPLIAFLSPTRPATKALLVFCGACVWIFGLVYPPFIIPAAFAMAILVLAFRRDVLTIANLTAGIVAVAVAGAVFYLYFGDLLAAMRNTVYPGNRIVGGGGVEEVQMLAHLLPFFTTAQFTPLLANSNACEVAVVSTLLPLGFLTFLRYRSLRNIPFSAGLWIAFGLLSMGCWMVFPVPAEVGAAFLWSFVLGSRMAWGFGLLLIVSLVALASRLEFRFSPVRIAIFAALLIAAWLGSKFAYTTVVGHLSSGRRALLADSWFDWIGIIPFAAAAIAVRLWPHAVKAREAMLAAAAVTGLVTFGTFNPIQRATSFFNLPTTEFIQSTRQTAADNPNGWAVLPGVYGALLNGAGIAAVNHVLTSPMPAFWARVFPGMSAQERHQVFDRYAHIVPEAVSAPYARQQDVIVVPLSRFQQKVE
jgi:hypothetical protein